MTRVLGFIASAVILVTLLVIFLHEEAPRLALTAFPREFREFFWQDRAIDLIGQMLIILAGTFGVLVLTKERIER